MAEPGRSGICHRTTARWRPAPMSGLRPCIGEQHQPPPRVRPPGEPSSSDPCVPAPDSCAQHKGSAHLLSMDPLDHSTVINRRHSDSYSWCAILKLPNRCLRLGRQHHGHDRFLVHQHHRRSMHTLEALVLID